ncbi:phosphoenolpyruvate carboxylase kinase 1-like [Typha angustifolia]|uniref:phosphoenolpyruvate carboxylase kinase 1-like n=1 Tax=Typha angustifolia TaxID=59011 RepID=UPI003C2B4686
MSEALKRDYEIGEELGRGRFGTVFRCFSRESGEPFALKSIDKSLLTDPIDRECADREAKIHRLVAAGNPGVVGIHEEYEDDAAIHLIIDLCPGGDLFDRISGSAPLPEPEAAAVTAALVEAIAACHRRGVAHRDVKPDNVLFDLKGRLRLSDFGSAEWFGEDGGEEMRGLVGTPYYVAPEVVAGKHYGEKVDVWSAGVILYMMLSGMAPFYGESAAETFEAVLRSNLRFPTRVFRSVSPGAKDLIRRMLCKDVSRRFSAEQVLRHPWITSSGGSILVEQENLLPSSL